MNAEIDTQPQEIPPVPDVAWVRARRATIQHENDLDQVVADMQAIAKDIDENPGGSFFMIFVWALVGFVLCGICVLAADFVFGLGSDLMEHLRS